MVDAMLFCCLARMMRLASLDMQRQLEKHTPLRCDLDLGNDVLHGSINAHTFEKDHMLFSACIERVGVSGSIRLGRLATPSSPSPVYSN